MTDEVRESADAPMSLRMKLIGGAVVAVILVASAWMMLRMSSPAIPPGTTPPAGHYPLSCGVCHTISADAVLEGH